MKTAPESTVPATSTDLAGPPRTPVLDKLIAQQDDAALTFAAITLQGSTDRTSGLQYWKIIDELRRRHPEAWEDVSRATDWQDRSAIEMLLPRITESGPDLEAALICASGYAQNIGRHAERSVAPGVAIGGGSRG